MDEPLSEEHIEFMVPDKDGQFIDWLPLLSLYILFMFGNSLLPPVFLRASTLGMKSAAMFLDGVIASEVGILGVWTALSCERWTHRLLGGGILLGLSTVCLLVGLQLQLPERATMPLEFALLICGIALSGWLSTWLVFAALRGCWGWQICSPRAPPHGPGSSQVSIKFLFVAITSTAALIALFKAVMPSTSVGNEGLATASVVSGIYIIYSLALVLPCCWISLRQPTPYWLVPLLLLELYVVGNLTMWCVASCIGLGPFGMRETAFFYEYSLGLIASALSVFAYLRYCGFQLYREPRSPWAALAARRPRPL